MTPEHAKLLGELLTEMGEDPKGFVPEEAWGPLQKVVALPYIEMAIVRRKLFGFAPPEILLTHRIDKDWNGWHIPGGLWRTRETLDEGIASLAKRELGPNARVTFLAKGSWEKWNDHPTGFPISHIVICRGENIVETETVRWFREPPDGMIKDGGHHAAFIRGVFQHVKEQRLV